MAAGELGNCKLFSGCVCSAGLSFLAGGGWCVPQEIEEE